MELEVANDLLDENLPKEDDHNQKLEFLGRSLVGIKLKTILVVKISCVHGSET